MEDLQMFLKNLKQEKEVIYKTNNRPLMAFMCIDTLCIMAEDGMNKKEALDIIYRFSHCMTGCKHEDWEKEMIEFYKTNVMSEVKDGI